MDIGAIFLILAVLILVALFLAQPLIEHRSTMVTEEEHELSSLMAEQDSLLTALQELDFDHTLGKIPAEEYPAQRADLLKRGTEILRRIDALSGVGESKNAQDRVEAAIAARRADAAVVKDNAPSDDDLESLISARRTDRKEKSGGFCPHCGKPVLRTDRFCPKCGKSIK